MQSRKLSVSPHSQGSNAFSSRKEAKSKRVTYDERDFNLKVGAKYQPNENQIYQIRVYRKCVRDLKFRTKEELKTLRDNQAGEKESEEGVIDPVHIAAMVVKDKNLFLEPKKPEKEEADVKLQKQQSNPEKDEFPWEFDMRELQYLKAQMQAYSNISPPAFDEEDKQQQREERQKKEKKQEMQNDYFRMIERQKRQNCKKYFDEKQLKLAMTTNQDDKKRNKNIEEALKYKMQEMTQKGKVNQRNWSQVAAKSTGQNTRPGYRNLIASIAQCNEKILKTKRGLSIFQDEELKDQINKPSKIPILKNEQLREKLNKMIKTTEKVSGYETVTQRTKEDRERKKTKAKAEAMARKAQESINNSLGTGRMSKRSNVQPNACEAKSLEESNETCGQEQQMQSEDTEDECFELKNQTKEYITKQRKLRFNRKLDELIYPENPSLFEKPVPATMSPDNQRWKLSSFHSQMSPLPRVSDPRKMKESDTHMVCKLNNSLDGSQMNTQLRGKFESTFSRFSRADNHSVKHSQGRPSLLSRPNTQGLPGRRVQSKMSSPPLNEAWQEVHIERSLGNDSQLIKRASILTPAMTSVVVSQQSINKNKSILSNKQSMNRTSEKLTQMDDYCQQAKVFTNREAQQRHTYEYNRDENQVYKSSLANAFKHCKDVEEMPGMYDFLAGKDPKEEEHNRREQRKRDLQKNPDLINQELRKFKRDDQVWRVEIEKLLGVLSSKNKSAELINKRKRSRKKKQEEFSKLIDKMQKIKKTQFAKEDNLKRTLNKVELDKHVLMHEKVATIWNDKLYRLTGPYDIKQDIVRQKMQREQINRQQRQGYKQVLQFIKDRKDVLPLAEEKQLLDCLKIVLDNEWVIGTDEMLRLFDLLQMKQKVKVSDEFTEILRFITLLSLHLKLDIEKIDEYFQ